MQNQPENNLKEEINIYFKTKNKKNYGSKTLKKGLIDTFKCSRTLAIASNSSRS